MRRYEISDPSWQRISARLPGKSANVGRTAQDNRQFLRAVLWMARSGAPWRDLPERYGPWNWSLPTLPPLSPKGRMETGL